LGVGEEEYEARAGDKEQSEKSGIGEEGEKLERAMWLVKAIIL